MPSPPPTPKRVLFVDDEPQFLATIQELMSTFSGGQWEIATATSASQAFGWLQEHPVDLIVVDVQMDVMDGIQMLSLLHRGYPHVRKAALTGYANDNYQAACLVNGAELFLEKPTEAAGWQNLYSALNELLRLKSEPGFTGVLRRVGLADVIQMECLARSSSILEIVEARTQGRIFIEHGQLVHAETGEAEGEAAFNQLLALSGGQFHLKPFAQPPKRTLSGQWEFLLMEAARKRDEAQETQPPAAPTTAGPDLSPAAAPPSVPLATEIEAATPADSHPGSAALPTPGPPSPAAPGRPEVEAMLICSSRGEVLYAWQCPDVELWLQLLEFFSQKAQRLAQGLVVGEFDRVEARLPAARLVLILSGDRGVMLRTRRPSSGRLPDGGGARGDRRAGVSEETREWLAEWLRRAPATTGVLVRALRFPDHTICCDLDSRDFPASALEQAARAVADTFQVLQAHQLPAARLVWHYQRAALHCADREDGTLLIAVALNQPGETDAEGLNRLLSEFRTLETPRGEGPA